MASTINTETQPPAQQQTDEQAFGRFMQRIDGLIDGLAQQTGDATVLAPLITRLDRLIDAIEKQPLKPEETLWSSDQIACWLGLSKQTVETRVVTRLGFPAALRPVDSKQAQRRWFASDVMEWARSSSGTIPTSRPGRRRKVT